MHRWKWKCGTPPVSTHVQLEEGRKVACGRLSDDGTGSSSSSSSSSGSSARWWMIVVQRSEGVSQCLYRAAASRKSALILLILLPATVVIADRRRWWWWRQWLEGKPHGLGNVEHVQRPEMEVISISSRPSDFNLKLLLDKRPEQLGERERMKAKGPDMRNRKSAGGGWTVVALGLWCYFAAVVKVKMDGIAGQVMMIVSRGRLQSLSDRWIAGTFEITWEIWKQHAWRTASQSKRAKRFEQFKQQDRRAKASGLSLSFPHLT